MMNATYSPDDNKLRLYSTSRLDAETYQRVKKAGFIWAPKQQLFVAPMWTPEREDLLVELCGEIEDEDKSLVERQEERAERFEDYSERRAEDADQAHKAVSAIADNIPLGQPILVGHHSERHARKDAERIESGMRKAVKMWETSKYWKSRAAGAIHHAKYKERPDVRARRIKGLEADRRRFERSKADAESGLKIWTEKPLTHEQALFIAGNTSLGHLQLPKKEGDREDWKDGPSAYTGLKGDYPNLYAPRTVGEVVEVARQHYPRVIANCDRWLNHIENRLEYEKAMLEDQGESGLLVKKPRPALLPLLNYRQEKFVLKNPWSRGEMLTYNQIDMTAAEYSKLHNDYKGTRVVDNSHRIRTAMVKHALVAVFLTDSKVHQKPGAEPEPPKDPTPLRVPPRTRETEEPTAFDFMKETLRQGVKVVTANQLFPTPPELARRMVEIAEIEPGQRVLEPSGGTGNILRAIQKEQPDVELIAVEVKAHLADVIRTAYRVPTYCKDFLAMNGEAGTFDRILMNPPFQNGDDIKHIKHAMHMLKPGGKLVAICANGPRQQEQLKPLAETWEELPEGTFSGTGVRAALLTIQV